MANLAGKAEAIGGGDDDLAAFPIRSFISSGCQVQVLGLPLKGDRLARCQPWGGAGKNSRPKNNLRAARKDVQGMISIHRPGEARESYGPWQ